MTRTITLELDEGEELALRRATTMYAARIMERTADPHAMTPSDVTRQSAMTLHEKVSREMGPGGMVFACVR